MIADKIIDLKESALLRGDWWDLVENPVSGSQVMITGAGRSDSIAISSAGLTAPNYPSPATGLPYVSGETIAMVSDSANDDSGGTGANSIDIIAIDTSWNYVKESVVMDGTTTVETSSNTLITLLNSRVLTSGSLGSTAGTISFNAGTTTASLYGEIGAKSALGAHPIIATATGFRAIVEVSFHNLSPTLYAVVSMLGSDLKISRNYTIDPQESPSTFRFYMNEKELATWFIINANPSVAQTAFATWNALLIKD